MKRGSRLARASRRVLEVKVGVAVVVAKDDECPKHNFLGVSVGLVRRWSPPKGNIYSTVVGETGLRSPEGNRSPSFLGRTGFPGDVRPRTRYIPPILP